MAFKVLTAVLSLGLALANKGVVDPFAGENGTNETELIYLGITPAPTPAPTAAGDIVVKTTTFEIIVELDSPDAFDIDEFKKAMAASMGVAAGDVEMTDVKFEVKTSYTFAVAITEAQAKKAIAEANSVTEADVTVKITSSRRLKGAERRLASTSVESTISVPAADAAKAKAIISSAADGAALATKLSTITGTTIAAPTVVAPVLSVTATTKVSTKGATAAKPPPASTFLTQLQVVAPGKTFSVKKVSTPVYGTAVVTPTSAPTPAPTVEPTPAPTEAGVGDNGASSTSVVGAFLATIAAVGATGFF